MSLLFDPLYPTVVDYVVTQSIWELYEVHFWQLLFGVWGKNRAFLTLQHRYEKKHYEGTALTILVLVFALSYLIEWLMALRARNQALGGLEVPQNNVGADQNRPNGVNGFPNE